MTDRPRPLNIAHRGASGTAPENTMVAFEQAVAMGADMIELDVQRTKDGHIVVVHDRTINRTSNGTGAVADRTLAELQEFDFGSWFDPQFAGEPVPTMADVFHALRDRIHINIELKNLPYDDPGMAQALVDLIKQMDYPADQLIISSFDHVILDKVKALMPELPCAVLFAHNPVSLAGLNTPVLHPHWQVIRPQFMEWVKQAQRKVNVYTVDQPDRWQQLIDIGVHGIITNYPGRLEEYLRENNYPRP